MNAKKLLPAAITGCIGAWLALRPRKRSADVLLNVVGLGLVAGAVWAGVLQRPISADIPIRSENQGEGDRESARRYNEHAQAFVQSGEITGSDSGPTSIR